MASSWLHLPRCIRPHLQPSRASQTFKASSFQRHTAFQQRWTLHTRSLSHTISRKDAQRPELGRPPVEHKTPTAPSTGQAQSHDDGPGEDGAKPPKPSLTIRENIYTIPNLLTLSRIASCPVIGWAILNDEFYLSTSLLVYASFSDWFDGFLARRYNMRSVLGTILDPTADKALVTTLTVTLAMKSLLPLPLAVIIIGRDVLLGLSAFYIRYTSLPPPKTFSRYWDFSIPSAEVRPTQISKYNTALQLLLMGSTAISPIVPLDVALPLQGLQWLVGLTTVWSGLSYVFSKDAVRIVSAGRKGGPPAP